MWTLRGVGSAKFRTLRDYVIAPKSKLGGKVHKKAAD